jgi:hypothetical protein
MILKMFAKTKTKLTGEYRGYVVDIMDPLELGRVRVKVWGVSDSDKIPNAALPWAKPKPMLTNGSIGKFGSFYVPDVNSKVSVEFENGNPLSPVYTTEAPDGLDGVPEFASANYPYRSGFALSNGVVFFIDKSTGLISFTHPSGTTITIDANGDVGVTSVQDINMQAGRNINITAVQNLTVLGEQNTSVHIEGSASIVCDSNLTISGATVSINP